MEPSLGRADSAELDRILARERLRKERERLDAESGTRRVRLTQPALPPDLDEETPSSEVEKPKPPKPKKTPEERACTRIANAAAGSKLPPARSMFGSSTRSSIRRHRTSW